MQMPGGHLLVSGWTETTPYIPQGGMAVESRSESTARTAQWQSNPAAKLYHFRWTLA
jgi:hypothetical protein